MEEELEKYGLSLSHSKTKWISTGPRQESVTVAGQDILPRDSIRILGSTFYMQRDRAQEET
eukprot:8274570-Prorocentrum_lima.AAC.1